MNYFVINKTETGVQIVPANDKPLIPSKLFKVGKSLAKLKQVNVEVCIPVTPDYSEKYTYTPVGTIFSNVQ